MNSRRNENRKDPKKTFSRIDQLDGHTSVKMVTFVPTMKEADEKMSEIKQNVTKPPGFWLRSCSVMIDLAAISLFVVLAANIAASFGLYIPIELTILALFALYNVICHSIWSCTLGKWACEIKVVRRNGQRIGYLASTTRAILKTLSLSLFGLPFIAVVVLTATWV